MGRYDILLGGQIEKQPAPTVPAKAEKPAAEPKPSADGQQTKPPRKTDRAAKETTPKPQPAVVPPEAAQTVSIPDRPAFDLNQKGYNRESTFLTEEESLFLEQQITKFRRVYGIKTTKVELLRACFMDGVEDELKHGTTSKLIQRLRSKK